MRFQHVDGFSLVLENLFFDENTATAFVGGPLNISEWRYRAKLIFYLIKLGMRS
jgi:hypothetical protein